MVTQLQYLSWPDHGTPDDPTEFVEFVDDVREMREKAATLAPTLVHCSAGIGRTGVLILMETALCLVEANQPVYPLDLTRSVRVYSIDFAEGEVGLCVFFYLFFRCQ